MERFVKIDGKWVHVVFEPEKTYVNGTECEFKEIGKIPTEPKDPADWWKDETK